MILAPNGLCIAGAFTMGFGVMTSVLTNNVAALAALANGMLPLRRIAQAQADSQLEQDRRVAQGLAGQASRDDILEIHTPEADIQIEVPAAERGPTAAEVVIDAAPPPRSMPWPTRTPIDIVEPSFDHLGECLFERPSRRTLDDELRRAILDAAAGRRDQLPFQAEFEWHAADPVLKFKSSSVELLAHVAAFTPGRIVIYAEDSRWPRGCSSPTSRSAGGRSGSSRRSPMSSTSEVGLDLEGRQRDPRSHPAAARRDQGTASGRIGSRPSWRRPTA